MVLSSLSSFHSVIIWFLHRCSPNTSCIMLMFLVLHSNVIIHRRSSKTTAWSILSDRTLTSISKTTCLVSRLRLNRCSLIAYCFVVAFTNCSIHTFDPTMRIKSFQRTPSNWFWALGLSDKKVRVDSFFLSRYDKAKLPFLMTLWTHNIIRENTMRDSMIEVC